MEMTYNERRHAVVKSVEEAEKLVNQFEIETVTKYTIFRRNKEFTKDLDCKYKVSCPIWCA